MNGACNKIRRKYGGVPAGNDSEGKIPGNHAVNRDNQRRCQGREKEIRTAVMSPLLEIAGPTQRENGKNFFTDTHGIVPDGCQIRQHSRVPEKGADHEIGADGHHVEYQRGLEVRPQVALVRVRQHVIDDPDTAQMDKGKESGNTDGKYGHGFCGAGDGVAPSGPEKMKDGRYQGSGVGDTDPEYKVDQVGAPCHRDVLAGHTDTDKNLIHPACGPDENAAEKSGDHHPVGPARRLQGIENRLVDLRVGEFSHFYLFLIFNRRRTQTFADEYPVDAPGDYLSCPSGKFNTSLLISAF